MDKGLLNRIPKKYHAAINDIYKDDDGFWCVISCKSGWKLKNYYSDYTIHEDNFTTLLKVVKESLIQIE